MSLPLLIPDWQAPKNVRACSTTRIGGSSGGAYRSFNLSHSIGDKSDDVSANRQLLKRALKLPEEPLWLKQMHGNRVIEAGKGGDLSADAAVCFEPGRVCAVLTADCLPIFLCSRDGAGIGLMHAGWRGMASGIIEETVGAMRCSANHLVAWLGPGIGPDAYQVGSEVRDAFLGQDETLALGFLPDNTGAWRMNLYELARLKLERLGVSEIGGGEFCTYADSKRFYSFRRDGTTGRMGHFIWLGSIG